MLLAYAFCSARRRLLTHLMKKTLMEPRGIVTMTDLSDVSFIRSVFLEMTAFSRYQNSSTILWMSSQL